MPDYGRVLPWRRQSVRVEGELTAIVDAYRRNDATRSIDRIQRAYRLAASSHSGQHRRSGEAYIAHPLAVSKVVAEMGLDDTAITAALLHDAVEDTSVTLDDVRGEFGEDVAHLVDGVTKLEKAAHLSKEEQNAATVRKMMLAVSQDLRVLIIKLADRLHNMETIAVMPAKNQRRKAQETLDIYAPLAHRLGMQTMKWRLEDLAFAALEPRQYAELESMVASRAPERDVYLTQVIGDIEARLDELEIDDYRVKGRPKHLYSIYGKMVMQGRPFNDIHDLVGVRVIVDDVRACYAALGSIHATWKPVPGRFKDWIAVPKFNLYQSLHTTVVGPLGKEVEVQIRTEEMDARAERGVAAHWGYKEAATAAEMAWFNRIADWEEDTSDPNEYLVKLKGDLGTDEVFVFTPKGKIVELPVGATPVDFAFSIHTEVGYKCTGAKVNGKLVPLESRLVSGDRVEIFTSKNPDAGPSKDWLNFVVTHKAGNKIRAWFSRERRHEFIETGRDELMAAIRRADLPVHRMMKSPELVEIATELNYVELDSLFAAIGEGHVSPRTIVNRLRRDDEPEVELTPETIARVRRRPIAPPPGGSGSGIHVEGLDDMLVHKAQCCTPVLGDAIIGYVTRGRGVSVHRTDCANAKSLRSNEADRLIEVEWNERHTGLQEASIELEALDRPGLLSDVAGVMASHGLNVISMETLTGADRIARMTFNFQFADPAHLEAMLGSVRRVESVYDAYRVLPGALDPT